MKVDWKDSADAERLRRLIVDASNAKQRDRYRVALIAGQGLAGNGPDSRPRRFTMTRPVSANSFTQDDPPAFQGIPSNFPLSATSALNSSGVCVMIHDGSLDITDSFLSL